ncbi:MAG: LysE family transporter [Candidatus Altiarchaeota archaeon]
MTPLLYLLSIGFIIGLSGAMLPGPLLVYTISESMKKGVKTGPLVILGHMIVEVFLIALIALGLSSIMTSTLFVRMVGVVGGFALVVMGSSLYVSNWSLKDVKSSGKGNIVLGGMFFSAFNPGFPVWWATAGLVMLIKGFELSGYTGVAVIVVGHWLADLGYFTLIAGLVHHGRESLLSSRWVNHFKNILSLILGVIGLYFIYWVSRM